MILHPPISTRPDTLFPITTLVRADSVPFVTLGLGKFISPNWSIDGELNYQNPSFEDNDNLNWSQYGISLDLRRHFIAEGRSWNPYLLAGLGYQRSEEEYDEIGRAHV